ncbi:MAG TPA: Mu-like prophage major head subunit gpT family protein, partial [Planctomycetota bacterium]|nr:Mu-like prophage major head subunit gpT family protein [Planctomycetota bacterium]
PVGGAPRVIALPDLNALGAEYWFLLRTDGAVRPFIFQDREPIEFAAKEQDSDEGFLREKYLYGVRARYRLTYGMWQHAYFCTMGT